MTYIKCSAAILCLITLFIVITKINIFDNDNNEQLDRNLIENMPMKRDNNTLSESDSSITNQTKDKYYILYWHRMFNTQDFYLGLGSDIFTSCPYSNCYVSHDKNYLPSIDKWDAIVFHGVEYQKNFHGVPERRSPRQNYIMYDLESPVYNFMGVLLDLNGFFNMTMTYRSDSEIYNPYGNVLLSKTNYTPPSLEEIAHKEKNKLAWFVSRCSSQSQRELLVQQLEKSFSVDIYGKCGTLSCSRSNDTECNQILETKYKFYLSFENAVCIEYVTEKLFRMLNLNVIPIVYGGANYSRVTPPHSVINVEDFKSVGDLVKYIKFLDNNHVEYLKYFEWKKHYRVDINLPLGTCNLCRALNEQSGVSKTYVDMDKWWSSPGGKSACFDSFINKTFLNTA